VFQSRFGGKSVQRDVASAHVLLPSGGVNAFVYNPPFVELQVHTGGLRYFNRFPERTFILTETFISTGKDTPPVGANLIVDILINDASVFADPGDRPVILDGETTGLSTAIATTAFAPGDYFTVNIIQVGSSTPGSDLTVQIAVV
jgi:hypothetical protein